MWLDSGDLYLMWAHKYYISKNQVLYVHSQHDHYEKIAVNKIAITVQSLWIRL